MRQYVATIGFFDGVHSGHRCLIEQVCAYAQEHGMGSLLVTFDRHPRQVLQGGYVPEMLLTLDEKLALLGATGADRVHVLGFTEELSRLTAREFMERVLRRELNVGALVMGYDHRFGHGGGSCEEYVAWGKACGIDVVFAKELGAAKVSSSIVRRLVADGCVGEANRLLGYTYSIGGEVVEGHQVGRTIGFPTANIRVSREKLLPGCGVYAVRAGLPDGSVHDGMLCIGHRPTVHNGEDLSVEVNLLRYEGNLYGQRLKLWIVARLREEVRFASLEELSRQLATDAEQAKILLQKAGEGSFFSLS